MAEARPIKSTCKHCKSDFYHRKWDRGLYCSRDCVDAAKPFRRHGKSGTREHAAWLDMRNRCRNPKCRNYFRYGGRGISVCERWDSFENFLADMGPRPGKGYSIERNDNNGNYEPGNCRWATQLEQSRNRRPWSEWTFQKPRASPESSPEPHSLPGYEETQDALNSLTIRPVSSTVGESK